MAELNEPCWRIEIANGPNAGAVVPLASGRYRVGLDPGNDIVLADREIAAEQATFEIGPGGVRLTALAPGAALRRRSLCPGTSTTIGAGSEVRIGSTVLRLDGPRRRTAGGLRLAWIAGALIACSTGAGYVFATPHNARATAQTGEVSAPGATTLAAAIDALRQRLRASALTGGIAIVERQGTLVASGGIAPDQLTDWNRTQQWFDAAFGRQFALLDRVRAQISASPDLALAAVSTLPIPVAIGRDGARYTEGAVLDGGWIIAHITTRAVTLCRNGQIIRMTL